MLDVLRISRLLRISACVIFALCFTPMIIIAATVLDEATKAALGEKATAVASAQYGGCAESPFPYLEQRHRPSDRNNSFVTPTPDGTRGLDTALACRLKKLLEFAESKGCRLTINSAMRPEQRCNPGGGACATQGNSCHQYGRAVDLGGTPQCLAWLTQVIGRKNPNSPFKLHVAYVENANYRHLQCTEHLGASFGSAGGCRSACSGGISINPDLSKVPGPGSYSPTSNLADRFRQSFGMQSNPSQQNCTLSDGRVVPCSSIQNSPQQQALSPSAAPVGAPAPIPTTQQSQQISQSFQDPALADPTVKLTGTNAIPFPTTSPSSTSSLSVTDQIGAIANPTVSSAESGTSTPLILTVSGSDAQTLSAEQAQNQQTMMSNETSTIIPPASQQTFTSGDLSQTPDAYFVGQQTGLQATLARMRETLLHVLAYLRPFGRPADEHYHE